MEDDSDFDDDIMPMWKESSKLQTWNISPYFKITGNSITSISNVATLSLSTFSKISTATHVIDAREILFMNHIYTVVEVDKISGIVFLAVIVFIEFFILIFLLDAFFTHLIAVLHLSSFVITWGAIILSRSK